MESQVITYEYEKNTPSVKDMLLFFWDVATFGSFLAKLVNRNIGRYEVCHYTIMNLLINAVLA